MGHVRGSAGRLGRVNHRSGIKGLHQVAVPALQVLLVGVIHVEGGRVRGEHRGAVLERRTRRKGSWSWGSITIRRWG